MHISSAVLYQHSQRPGQHQQSCQPEGHLGTVPRHPVWVYIGYQVFSEVHVLQLHPLPGLHVIIQTLDLREEPGSLVEVIIFWAGFGEAETFGEA